MSTADRGEPRDDSRLLPLIAAERTIRSVLLIAIGIALLTHTHEHWDGLLSHIARSFGFDPQHGTLSQLIAKARRVTPGKTREYGIVAIAYGILEGFEAYGLWRRRRWGEYLTIVATAVLFIPEIVELTKSVTALKLVAIALNVVIVAYLITRIRRRPVRGDRSPPGDR